MGRVLKTSGIVCVYPMHMSREEVERLPGDKGLELIDEKFDGRILLFLKEPENLD